MLKTLVATLMLVLLSSTLSFAIDYTSTDNPYTRKDYNQQGGTPYGDSRDRQSDRSRDEYNRPSTSYPTPKDVRPGKNSAVRW